MGAGEIKDTRVNWTGVSLKKKPSEPLSDVLTQVNELPEIGTRVIVKEKEVYSRETKDLGAIRIVDSPSYFNAWNKPREFTVEGYTKGIENPLDYSNLAILKYTAPNGYSFIQHIHTVYIASGSMFLCPVEKTK